MKFGLITDPDKVYGYVPTVNQAGFAQALSKCLNHRLVVSIGRQAYRQESYSGWILALLCTRRERPRNRCPAEQRDELTPF